jgi:hypothetical protein
VASSGGSERNVITSSALGADSCAGGWDDRQRSEPRGRCGMGARAYRAVAQGGQRHL